MATILGVTMFVCCSNLGQVIWVSRQSPRPNMYVICRQKMDEANRKVIFLTEKNNVKWIFHLEGR